MTKVYLFARRIFTVFLVLTAFLAQAQERTVSGRVTASDDGSAIPGVNILEKGTSNGTVSDTDGNFTISVGSNAVLVFSFVGYASQEVTVGTQTNLDIKLQSDITSLSEVVVVGYGTQQKKEITSAVASVSEEQFNKGNVTSPTQLLSGKVAGLSVVRPGGDPNQGFTLRLRGISTFGANSSPLIVIDGIVGASLDNVDPNDVASMDVLKDASAAAIYGARGSSGVILITTKTGKVKKGGYVNVNYNGFVGIDEVANKLTVLSADEFVARGGTDYRTAGAQGTNWFNALTQTGTSHTNNISVEGSSGTTSYRASVNYRKTDGIVKGVDNDRLNTSLSINNTSLNGKLRFNFGLTYNDRNQNSINLSAFRYAVIYNPTAPVFEGAADNRDGGYFQRDLFDFYNPVALSRQQRFGGERKNLLSNYRIEYDIIEDLTVALNYSVNEETGLNGSFWSKKDRVTGFGVQGQARRDTYNNTSKLLELTTKYTKKFGDLNFEGLVGFANQSSDSEGFAVQTTQFLYDFNGWDGIDFGSQKQGNGTEASSYRNANTLRSVFGRANLNYKGTYFLSATVRSDSYSGFGKGNKTGYFPAVSGGVEVTKLVDLGVVSQLKVRGSYGVSGNLPPAADLALATFAPGGIIDFDGNPLSTSDQYVSLRQTRDANPSLKWETKTEINVGVDYGLFDGRITGSIEYYTRTNKDLLYGVALPAGAPNPFDPKEPANVANFAWANIGSIASGGFEFSATYNNVKLGGISWSPSLNFTIYQKAKIESFKVGDLGPGELRLATPGSPGQNANPMIRNRVGETLGNMYGPKFQGLNENGAYVFDSTDPTKWGVIGNGLPSAELGFTNNFTYKNWDLSFVLRGVFGHTLYNSYRGFYENRDAGSRTWNSVTTSKTPFVTSVPEFSSLYIEDASFLRLDNVSIGYNLPLKSGSFSNLRLYATGQNLFTITNYTGIDPEVRYGDTENGDGFQTNLAPGIERRNTYFTTRTYTFGVSLRIK
jgi:TonB-linked SusC/RagA family outer membrane protein